LLCSGAAGSASIVAWCVDNAEIFLTSEQLRLACGLSDEGFGRTGVDMKASPGLWFDEILSKSGTQRSRG
jgi:hypothetical protein